MRFAPLLALLLGTSLALPAFAQSSGSGMSDRPATEPAAPGATIETQQPGTETEKPNPLAPLLKGLLKTPQTEEATPPPAAEETPPAEEQPPATAEELPPEDETVMPETEEVAPAAPRASETPEVAEERERSRTYQWVSPRRLERLIREGVDELRVDTSGGDTTLEGTIDGTDFQVYFYECDGGDMASVAEPNSRCLGYEFRAYFLDYPTDAEQVNQWNADHHYGKLWIDNDGDLAVQLNVIVEGGIKEDNVKTTLIWFKAVLEGVHDFYR
ncbi:MAG TPA: YbjN domain-containing protein [Paracoccaceae bacterium]|nr:YbjN domain-containing protein [Paracoccaceae bacterium]